MMEQEQTLSRKRKAAMVAQLALREGPLSLADLPEDVQITLAREIGAIRLVDRDTLESVAEEFAREVERLVFAGPGGIARTLEAYESRLSAAVAQRLREEGANAPDSDPWPVLAALSLDRLQRMMERESTEVCAVVLSKLPVSKAAELLGMIDGAQARRITYAVARTGSISPAAVTRIGRALRADYCSTPPPAFVSAAGQRLGAILNNSRTDTRETVLEGLGEEDPDFAEEVRRAIFTFADIPRRIRPADVPKILRKLDGGVVVTALGYARARGNDRDVAALEYVLENLSQRLANQISEEIAERGEITRKEAEAATAELVGVIRDAVTSGELSLQENDDDES